MQPWLMGAQMHCPWMHPTSNATCLQQLWCVCVSQLHQHSDRLCLLLHVQLRPRLVMAGTAPHVTLLRRRGEVDLLLLLLLARLLLLLLQAIRSTAVCLTTWLSCCVRCTTLLAAAVTVGLPRKPHTLLHRCPKQHRSSTIGDVDTTACVMVQCQNVMHGNLLRVPSQCAKNRPKPARIEPPMLTRSTQLTCFR